MRICNFGSLNIDHVYRLPHVVLGGETLASTSYQVFAGGKGANQSAALAKAGAAVHHAGQVGGEGRWLIDKLAGFGVHVEHTRIVDDPTGHAIIQVDDAGQNAIVTFAGANRTIPRPHIDAVLGQFTEGDLLLLQNEVNDIGYLIETAKARGLAVCLNPAPFDAAVTDLPLDGVGVLIVNEHEAAGLGGATDAADDEATLESLAKLMPAATLVLTQGERGALFHSPDQHFHTHAAPARAVDTTAAGDTFIGYFLAAHAAGEPARQAVETACRAAAICVARPGAMDSIPTRSEFGPTSD